MTYTINDLLWLFFTYSFLGWCLEVIFSAFKRRKFVNRGFINSPLCTIYGFGSVLFAIFLPELTDSIFFLALGGGLLATVLEYATGMLMEKIFRRKLWDYSNIKFNIGNQSIQKSIDTKDTQNKNLITNLNNTTTNLTLKAIKEKIF